MYAYETEAVCVGFCSASSDHPGDACVIGHGQALDLSVRGCRIVSETPVRKGALLRLRLGLPNHAEAESVLVDCALVQWVDGCSEFGVEFLTFNGNGPERIRRSFWSARRLPGPGR